MPSGLYRNSVRRVTAWALLGDLPAAVLCILPATCTEHGDATCEVAGDPRPSHLHSCKLMSRVLEIMQAQQRIASF